MIRNSRPTLLLFAIFSIGLGSTLAHAQSSSKPATGSDSKAASNTKMDSESVASVGQRSSRLVTVNSQQSFKKTYDALKQAIKSKDLKILAEIDHSKNAKTKDMELPPTKVILFGNPKVGTPLMQANQAMALDLPQRMAVYEDAQGEVHIVYNNPRVIARDHQLAGQDEIIGKISDVLKMLANTGAAGDKK